VSALPLSRPAGQETGAEAGEIVTRDAYRSETGRMHGTSREAGLVCRSNIAFRSGPSAYQGRGLVRAG
jgi:hypothetical protein